MLTCFECKVQKDHTEFSSKQRKAASYMLPTCLCCQQLNRRKRHLKKTHNLTDEERAVMFIMQGGKCAICGKLEKEVGKKFGVDHHHISGKIRKLLCYKCNLALGLVKEDPEILISMLSYLKEHND